MALERKDRVKDQTTTTGTGTVTIGGVAPTGYRTITSAHTTGATVRYVIQSGDLTEWEVGQGVWTSSGTTLTRATVYASSNSGALVNFSAGTKTVFTGPVAEDITRAPTYPLMNYGGYQFDGSTDYLDGNALTGIADGKKGTLVICVRFADSSPGASQDVITTTGAAVRVIRTATFEIQILLENAAGTTIGNISTTGDALNSAGTYMIMASWDLATPGSGRLYVNDVSNYVENTFTNDTIDYTVTEWAIGGNGSNFWAGDAYIVWFDATTNLEFNTESVRRKFADANNVPVYLGANGELPTGTAPILFLGYDDFGNWPRNRGTAVTTFTENGTPGAVGTTLYGQYAPLEDYSIIKTVTADYTVQRTDRTIINNRAATNTLTLPAANANKGRVLRIITIQAQTVVSAASDVTPIAGGAAGTAILAAADGAWADIESDGTSWIITAS